MRHLGSDDAVRIAVSDDLQVQVVGVPAPGQHRVQLLPRLPSGDQAVHSVRGDALGGVHGGGVTELDRGGDVVGGQSDGAAVADVPHGQVAAAADHQHGPPVAVLHPVVDRGAEPAVVAAGDDPVTDTGLVAVGQGRHSTSRRQRGCLRFGGEPVAAGALVELAGELAGRGQHDRVQTTSAVGLPGAEHVIGDGGEVADVYS